MTKIQKIFAKKSSKVELYNPIHVIDLAKSNFVELKPIEHVKNKVCHNEYTCDIPMGIYV